MRQSSRLLGVVVVLQSLILLGQWTAGGGGFAQPAMAQVSDPGAQRIEMIGELRQLNGKMDRLIGILEGRELQVQVAMPDEKKEEEPAR